MTLPAPIFRILPEGILLITGIIIMLVEAVLPKNASRKPLGWLAVVGSLFTIAASQIQFRPPCGNVLLRHGAER